MSNHLFYNSCLHQFRPVSLYLLSVTIRKTDRLTEEYGIFCILRDTHQVGFTKTDAAYDKFNKAT